MLNSIFIETIELLLTFDVIGAYSEKDSDIGIRTYGNVLGTEKVCDVFCF